MNKSFIDQQSNYTPDKLELRTQTGTNQRPEYKPKHQENQLQLQRAVTNKPTSHAQAIQHTYRQHNQQAMQRPYNKHANKHNQTIETSTSDVVGSIYPQALH
jgi:hypothetical protein